MGGDIKIWLLRVKDINDEFEWVEKHTVRLQRIIDKNWNIFSNICKNIKKRRKAAKVLARLYYIKPLPYSGGELVWFSINTINEMQIEQRVMVFNMRTRMLKTICDDVEIRLPLREKLILLVSVLKSEKISYFKRFFLVCLSSPSLNLNSCAKNGTTYSFDRFFASSLNNSLRRAPTKPTPVFSLLVLFVFFISIVYLVLLMDLFNNGSLIPASNNSNQATRVRND
ncbi:hypothetical protein Sjap_017395 [Stephania japonica]|uniref:Uncharacterized protein n=1 Tax=Stephania japonica TaxID=461633 RepID=A0AAP0I671_9MAGN